jgi:hypothetical protein
MNLPINVKYVSLIDSLCRLEDDVYYCRTKIKKGGLLQVDSAHLSGEGSKFVVDTILSDKIIKILHSDVSG